MRVEKLWNKHKGEDVWVIGTGPSMRVFPRNVYQNKITIGLNQAWRFGPVTYSLTVHPELYLEYAKSAVKPDTQWIVKKKPPMEALSLDHPDLYVFNTSESLDVIKHPTRDTLFLAKGIHCTALALAAQMGATNVFVVGCDACQLGGDHHGHAQHVRYHGLAPEQVFAEYRRHAARVRRVIRESLGVNVVTVSPFVGLGHADEDYRRLLLEHGFTSLPRPKDTSPYKRRRPDL